MYQNPVVHLHNNSGKKCSIKNIQKSRIYIIVAVYDQFTDYWPINRIVKSQKSQYQIGIRL